MKLSARARYASRLLLDLALNADRAPLNTSRLSEHTGISVKFIEQIIKPLKQAGLVRSVRGAAGGHILVGDPDEITLGQVVRIMEGGINLTHCCDDPSECARAGECRTREAWVNISRILERELDAITLTNLLDGPPGSCPNLCNEDGDPGAREPD